MFKGVVREERGEEGVVEGGEVVDVRFGSAQPGRVSGHDEEPLLVVSLWNQPRAKSKDCAEHVFSFNRGQIDRHAG